VIDLGKLRYVPAGNLAGDELAAARQPDGFIKPPLPTTISHSRAVAIIPNPNPA
jgi:hypothetical protein